MLFTSHKTDKEYLEDLGEALKERGRLEASLAQLQVEKKEWFKAAWRAKWFSEDRYEKWANYFTTKARICHLKKAIAGNNHKISTLESRIAAFGVPASTGSEEDCVEVDAEVVPDDDPNITFFQNDGLNAGFEDAN